MKTVKLLITHSQLEAILESAGLPAGVSVDTAWVQYDPFTLSVRLTSDEFYEGVRDAESPIIYLHDLENAVEVQRDVTHSQWKNYGYATGAQESSKNVDNC
jgi:hypothetical protein